ncbi:MAG: hypothetical protein AAFZ63_17455 [Bacteroidota bacterium]
MHRKILFGLLLVNVLNLLHKLGLLLGYEPFLRLALFVFPSRFMMSNLLFLLLALLVIGRALSFTPSAPSQPISETVPDAPMSSPFTVPPIDLWFPTTLTVLGWFHGDIMFLFF